MVMEIRVHWLVPKGFVDVKVSDYYSMESYANFLDAHLPFVVQVMLVMEELVVVFHLLAMTGLCA